MRLRSYRQFVLPSCMILILTLVLTISILPFTKAMANDGVSDLSMYQRASELTREFATALAPGSQVNNMYMLQDNNSDELLKAGNAGGLLGYAEILSDDTGIVGWLMNSYTAASATITYDQLKHVVDNGCDLDECAGLRNPFFQYAGYGDVLTEMGLVTTIRPGGLESSGRTVASGIVFIVYLLASVAPFLFRGALLILSLLNPFKLFETVFNSTADADLGILSGVAEYVGTLYKTVQDFSIYFLFPMLLALTTISVLMFNQRGMALKKFSRYGVRVFMLFAGLPLIGASYTGLVNDLNAKVSVGSEYADYLILSSYVDDENWIKYSRLAPPENSNIHNPRYKEDEKRSISSRSMILDINGTRANNQRAETLKGLYSSTSDIGTIFEKGGTQTDVDLAQGNPTPGGGSTSTYDEASFSTVYSMLYRHMTGALYTSSDYDGEVSGQIQNIRSKNKANDESIVKMYSLSASDSRTWSSKLNPFSNDPAWMKPIFWNGEDNDVNSSAKGLFTDGAARNSLFQFPGFPYNIYNSGNLQYNADKGYYVPDMDTIVTKKSAPIGVDKASTIGGLSPIAMYNFLNTTFSNTGLTVYSPQKTASDLSRDAYASVAFGGSGVSSVMRWIENVVVMLSLASLSIAYGVMMITLAVRNIPRILSGVFGTALGSIAFTTKLLISVAVLIIQIIGSIVLYMLSENIIMTILLNFNKIIDAGGEYFGSGVAFDFLNSLLVSIIIAFIAIQMIRNSNKFKEIIEESVSSIINRIMGVLDTSTGGRGLDMAQTTGGRVGGDGRLTDAARQQDSGGLLGGVGNLLGAAHGIESKREGLAKEMGDSTGSIADKLKARGSTAKDLFGAKGKDLLKSMAGVEGKSLEREMGTKESGIKALPYSQKAQDEFAEDHKGDTAEAIAAIPNGAGQTVDNEGNVILTEDGHAMDINGNPISANTALGDVGAKVMVDDNGTLMDANGNAYLDEAGNAFYQNDQGFLVDSEGAAMALDHAGILAPVSDGSFVSAASEAKKLDSMRFDSGKFLAMKSLQSSNHLGVDKQGNAVDAKGEPLQVQSSNGLAPAHLDNQGFVTDSRGNRVDASSVAGVLDPKAYKEVKDAATGATYLQHAGDAAMRAPVTPSTSSGEATLSSLSLDANKANAVAEGAMTRVADLKASGASPYAIRQAERYADQSKRIANTAQQAFDSRVADERNGLIPTSMASFGSGSVAPVTLDEVSAATRQTAFKQKELAEGLSILNNLNDQGAAPKVIARQKRRVQDQRLAVAKAVDNEQTMTMAQNAGRTFNEVSTARNRVDKAETIFANAQQAYNDAAVSNAPKSVLAMHQDAVTTASRVLSNAESNLKRMSGPPSGTVEQIDQANRRFDQAQVAHQQAKQKMAQLQQSGASTIEISAAQKQVESMAVREQQAKQAQYKFTSPKGWNPKSTPIIPEAPTVTPSESYAALATSGITNYDQYKQEISKHASTLKTNKDQLKQAKQRLSGFRNSGRPPLVIEHAESEVRGHQRQVAFAQEKVNHLQEHAQGLLKDGGFQPPVASRPIRQNASFIIGQMINMNQTQKLKDKLMYQKEKGTLSKAGASQLESLNSRLTYMRKDLVNKGIREEHLKDQSSIQNSTKHLQQSWSAFLNGESVE